MQKEEQISEMSSKEYDVLIRKAGQIHEYELNKSFGTRDYFRYYKKTYKSLFTYMYWSLYNAGT